VDETNFDSLLKAAGNRPWRLLTPQELKAFTAYLKGRDSLEYPGEGEEKDSAESAKAPQNTVDLSVLWSKVRVFSVASDGEYKSKPDDDPARKEEFTAAWRGITGMVEDEVLKAIGLPSIHVYMSYPEEIFGDRPCFYDEATQTIFLRASAVNAPQIQHEFGHHIEEQCPVEIWFGLASILHWMSADRGLLAPFGDAREVVYPLPQPPSGGVGVPDFPYCASYYPDAGTELLAYSLQWNVLASIDTSYLRWRPNMRDQPATVLGDCQYGPELVLLLLHALRPGEMRAAGFLSPALL
jgi:hypothetical protein